MGRVDISFLGKCLNNTFLNNRMKTNIEYIFYETLNYACSDTKSNVKFCNRRG